ncbi:DISARM system phospholipase D-like protein DrmC [Streptomyces sp. ISL-100]|uniref:DISARM system phospholipase D-like protein DrmC n=1 Tax=Streptomyces sp. ISL-100 TaxID=2819173 RepID=UPI001BEA85F3|nr:DISARM system phospholipase D-like protein DrmC [Streptomyces sp. ISL-100]MBT2400385.1 DISARM system phospholipase D-like protein DrmC [Streptomyces sp. ISL-100]
MSRSAFEDAAHLLADSLGSSRTKDVAGVLARGRGHEHALAAVQGAGSGELVTALYVAADRAGIPYAEAAAYLRGYVAGWTQRRDEVDVRTVWSGPATPGVPVRSTARVLVEVVTAARTELLAMTYSARHYAPLTAALNAAVARGVEVHIVVETQHGAGGLLSGPEPSAAFTGIAGLRLWHWDPAMRETPHARQHAKLAVADRRTLFLGSANLTESGVRRNLEAGVLIRGGSVPQRAADHIRELQRRHVLKPLSTA